MGIARDDPGKRPRYGPPLRTRLLGQSSRQNVHLGIDLRTMRHLAHSNHRLGDEAAQSVSQNGAVEVYRQADFAVAAPPMRRKLHFMRGRQPLDRFYLENRFVFDNDIGTVGGGNRISLGPREQQFAGVRRIGVVEFPAEALGIDASSNPEPRRRRTLMRRLAIPSASPSCTGSRLGDLSGESPRPPLLSLTARTFRKRNTGWLSLK
jgi:hypothetical protein